MSDAHQQRNPILLASYHHTIFVLLLVLFARITGGFQSNCFGCQSPKSCRLFQSSLENAEYETPLQSSTHRLKHISLIVAQSELVKPERGLFLYSEFPKLIEAGDILCGYGGYGNFVESVGDQDKAVSYHLDASSLVVYRGRVSSVQAVISETGAKSLKGHSLTTYGPNGMGLRLSSDSTMRARILVPSENEEFDWISIGQYANDHAFSEDLLQQKESLWKYEERSNSCNHVSLCWHLHFDKGEKNLFPDGARLVARREFWVNGTVELGCHYGMNYWRQMEKNGAHSFDSTENESKGYR